MFNIKNHLRLPIIGKREPEEQPDPIDHDLHVQRLRELLYGLDLMLDDDAQGVKSAFSDDTVESAVGRSGSAFYNAILGLEPKAIEEATEALYHAEQVTEERKKHFEHHDRPIGSYPAGMELQLCLSDIYLMQSALGFVSDSIVDSMKAAYRIRKTFLSFSKMMEHVRDVQHKKETGEIKSLSPNATFIDEFIESGVITGYGVLTFLVSMFPPSLSRILSLFSFHGVRKESLELLWRASKYPNIQGAIALLCLYAFNAMIQSLGSIPPSNYDQELEHCLQAVKDIRKRYSKGALWAVMEAKIYFLTGESQMALEMEELSIDSSMEQIIAMKGFDTAMLYVGMRKFKQAADAIIELEDLNSWSHAFYRYFAGCCLLQHGKEILGSGGSEEEAKASIDHGIEYLKNAPTLVQKKKKRRTLPVEAYLIRKVQKWEDRAEKLNISIADAMDVPPYAELIYIFVICSLKDPKEAEALRADLETCKCSEEDEAGLKEFLLGVIDRHLKEYDSCRVRMEHVLQLDQGYLSRDNRELWILPFAYYELAALYWDMHGMAAEKEVNHYLKKAQEFNDYDLQNRLSMLAQAATQTLQSEK
ncbi:hypothetical protein POMI540_1943 [Schizosaccharomyces pombe]|uniref:Uncharacterized protein C11E3.14 n=1 Tax=Schizosaccharomyces pombe (strain 972 / ATCC 24843) TaxID=284812 RepID=YDYE_SCHPO|nr:uncharacterized protein SPAC11E3.14 [Schizosaccharomyces pombe]O13693.1 RecName: Full=Uncharacterized protein C11E3.14 [Schizosaccharomyces pombe 972h-]CAB11193.1 conserved eukaryotic protein [Schizosaccharomyces pombe]|eukprot:NP_594939.1 uncharacterized protein SPAC11E3.14 [Schizosaccharomyces pombe]